MTEIWIQELLRKVVAVTSNATWHLALVAWLVFAAILIRAALIRQKLDRVRKAIPLSVGGWGTRGKSGTERLKAALFQAFRYDVVVKTTGCEAMFIHARRDLPGRELFLYRPYDKATIWEQEKVLTYGSKLRGQVFLWECMALNPQFVEVLNREWMQDEVVTLTNAYPDHEDIMGPSGQDVARVIATFMPDRGVAYTAEEQMLPVLSASARERSSILRPVDPLVADLLPTDLLARYPYDEHPRNIALVLALAEHFGLDRERSLCRMADLVVPDLGVLKTYPEVPHLGRRLSFSNGMSANERAGFLSNWERLHFGKIGPDESPEVYTVAVINNRADRVPRSRVFAEIFARDVVVDRIVCIGTNLGGLRSFIDEAVTTYVGQLTLDLEDPEQAREQLSTLLAQLRLPCREDALQVRLRSIASSLLSDGEVDDLLSRVEGSLEKPEEVARSFAEAIAKMGGGEEKRGAEVVVETDGVQEDFSWKRSTREHLVREVPRWAKELCSSFHERKQRVETIRELVERADPKALDLLRQFYRKTLMDRVFVQENAGANGNQTLDFIARVVPPGFVARLLGCQNIKGTGLDFVYRWISIGQVVEAIGRLKDPGTRQDAIDWLGAHGDYGIADVRLAAESVAPYREQQQSASGAEALLRSLIRTEEGIVKKMSEQGRKGPLARVLNWVEPWLDHLDSIRRSRGAAKIMTALFAQRISQAKAAILLRDLVSRQKGGWLAKDVERWTKR